MEYIDKYVWFQEGPGVRKHQYTSEGIKLLNVANLVDGKIDLSTSHRYISKDEAITKYKHFLVDEGDLIIASSGIQVNYFDKKMGFARKEHLPLCMNTSTIRFKVLDSNVTNIKYFMWFLKSQVFKKQLSKLITGSAQLNFGPSHLKKIKINMPMLQKQEDAVKELNRVQEIIDIRKNQIEELDKLTKSQFVEMFGFPYIDSKFSTCKLEKCVKSKEDMVDGPFGSHVNTKTDYIDDGEIPVIRTINVKQMSFLSENLKFMNRGKYEKIIRSQVLPGDIVITKVGTIGNVCVFPEEFKEAVLSTTGSCRVRVNQDEYNTKYIAYNLLFSKEKMNEIASAGVQPFLNMKHIRNLEIIDSPIHLQNQFAEFVKLINKQKFEIQKSLEEMQKLQESLMNKYFG